MLAFRLPMDLERIPEPIIVAAVVCVGGIIAVTCTTVALGLHAVHRLHARWIR